MNTWNLLLPQGTIEVQSSKQGKKTALIMAGGRAPDADWLLKIATVKDIYCADKGIESCFLGGLKPLLLCGDGDSAPPEYWQKAENEGIRILRHNPMKDDTDLQLLLAALPEQIDIIASGIWGGRFDHLYSNVFSLLAYKHKRGVQVALADEQEVLILLDGDESLVLKPTCRQNIEALSLLPLTNRNEVTLQGVQWNLEYSPLLLAHPYAISNMATEESVTFTCNNGSVGFYLKYKI